MCVLVRPVTEMIYLRLGLFLGYLLLYKVYVVYMIYVLYICSEPNKF